jgi:hypothetical protein
LQDLTPYFSNLFQSAFTGFCPLAMILKKMGAKSAAAF